MAVKDLVGLFEAQSSDSSPQVATRRRTKSPPPNTLPQSPARFVKHPLLPRREDAPELSGDLSKDKTSRSSGEPCSNQNPTTSHDFATTITTSHYSHMDTTDTTRSLAYEYEKTSEETSDVTDELLHHSEDSLQMTSRWNSTTVAGSTGAEYEMRSLLHAPTITPGESYSSHTIRPRSPFRLLKSETSSLTSATTITAVQTSTSNQLLNSSLGAHTPIAATTIFARSAMPLSLPALDRYISRLPPPSLPSVPSSGKGKGKDICMFPPMDRLAATGRTLEDLETNSSVAPGWRNRNTILGALVRGTLGVTGSSALAPFYSLHGLFDTIQIFALILNTIAPHGKETSDHWRKLILGTIPNILALNLATSTVLSLVLLLIFMFISGALLYYFHRSTSLCCRLGISEGLQQSPHLASKWGLLIATFILTVLYLPLSTMAMHVLVWSEDLWVVPNPYVNATSYPPEVSPLGPPDEFRDPLNFCWTTTMKRNQINFAPIVIIIAFICIAVMTVWFPIHLRRTVRLVAPKVDKYTELGIKRSQSDMDREYQRLLARDRNPLNFLYNDFRRGWSTYESVALLAKLTTLLLTAIVDPDNCLFRSLPRNRVAVSRQILLLIAMLGFFLLQCILAPFLDPVNNASEWTSRANYVVTSAVSLGVALNIPAKDALNGPVLYIIYVVTYGLSFYFTIINTGFMRRIVKRLARRIDFSIDIFSPRIDLSPASNHPKRRIWQEAITALFLTSPECGIPKEQHMHYAEARDSEYPPYLLDFAGTPGERHVENLKILREAGKLSYAQGVALVHGPEKVWFQQLEETIQLHFVGPDCYWRDPKGIQPRNCTRFFGNAWWIPFPPTLVFRYDDGPLAVLRDVSDLELYVKQNASRDIMRRREVRMALRALDGKVVQWPYEHIQLVGSRWPSLCSRRRYRAHTAVLFRSALFSLNRHGQLLWEDQDFGSGFEVKLKYAKNVSVHGTVIGLNEDYDLTTPLARFLVLNEALITEPLSHLEAALARYRHNNRQECLSKAETLTYRFLTHVYDVIREPDGLAQSSIEFERDLRVRQLMVGSEMVFEASYARFSAVTKSELATWWYIFWDDLWRRNYDTISGIKKYASDFNPHYPTSIAYTPLPRAALENFLTQRGLLHRKPKFGDFFHAGFLNKIYIRMYDIVFHSSKRADIIHIGDDSSELNMEEVDLQTQARPSTLGTGGGTDHDDESIRARPLYRWEAILTDKLSQHERYHPGFLSKLGVWFGVSPRWRAGMPSRGLALDVRVENGRYVLLRDDASTPSVHSSVQKGSHDKA